MINDIFNSLISQNSLSIESAKTEIKKTVEAEFKNKIKQELSDPENIKLAFESQNITTTDDLKVIEDIYKNFKDKTKHLLNIIEGKETQINAIKSKLDVVQTNFDKLDPLKVGPVKTVYDLIPITKLAINAAQLSLGVFTGPISNALVEKELSDKIDKIKSKIEAFEGILITIISIRAYMVKKIQPLLDSINAALNAISPLRETVEQLLLLIDIEYLNTVAPYLNLLTDTDTLPTGNDNIELDSIIIENSDNIINLLPVENRTSIIQYMELKGNKFPATGYRIIRN